MDSRLLLIDDDLDLLAALRSHLEPLGYKIETCSDGKAGLAKALNEQYDLIVADVKLPGLSGFDICREIRFNRSNVPLLILSAQNDVMDRVVGLEIGADDYLIKPFNVRELTARIDALIRRATRAAAEAIVEDEQLVFDTLTIDRSRMRVTKGDEVLALSATEYRVLETLALHPGRVFSRDQLRDAVWGYSASSFEHTVTTTLHRLRSKIEDNPSEPRFIISVRGVGYRFVERSELEGGNEKST